MPRKDVFDQESGEKEKNEEIIRGGLKVSGLGFRVRGLGV